MDDDEPMGMDDDEPIGMDDEDQNGLDGSEAIVASAEPLELAPSAGLDPFEAIRRLGELRDSGLITEAQFEAKRTEILNRL